MYSQSHSPVASTRSIHRDFGSVRSIHTAAANVSKTEEEEDSEMLVQHTTNRFSLIGKPREAHENVYLRTTWNTDDFKCWLSLTSDFRDVLLRALEGTEVFTREAASLKRSNTILSPFVLAVARRRQKERQDKANYRRARLVELAHAKKLRAKALEMAAQSQGEGGEEVTPCQSESTSPVLPHPPPFKEVNLVDNRLEDWIERLSCCTDWVVVVPADNAIPDTKTRKNIDRFLKWHLMVPITSTAKPGTWAHKALMTAERLKECQNVRSVRDNIEMGGIGAISAEDAVTTMRMMATQRIFTDGGGRSNFGFSSSSKSPNNQVQTNNNTETATRPTERSPLRDYATSHFLGGGGSTLDDSNIALNQPSRESIAFWVGQHNEVGRIRQESLGSVGQGGFASFYGKADSQISATGPSSAGGLTNTQANTATRSGFTSSSTRNNLSSAATIGNGTISKDSAQQPPKKSKATLEMEKIQRFVDRQRNRYVSAMSPVRCGIDVYIRGEDGKMHGPGSRIGAGIKSDEEIQSAATLTTEARFGASASHFGALGSQSITDASSYPYEGELRLFGDGWGKKIMFNRIPILKIEQIRLSSFLSPMSLRRFNIRGRRNEGVGGVTGNRYPDDDEYADEDFDNNEADDDDGSPTITVLLISKSFFVTHPVSLGSASYFGLRFDTSPKALSFISEVDSSGRLLQYLTDEVVKMISTWVNFDLTPPEENDGFEGNETEEPQSNRNLRGGEEREREYGNEDPLPISPTNSDHPAAAAHAPGMNFDFTGRVRAYSNAQHHDSETRVGYGGVRSRASSVISDSRSATSHFTRGGKNLSMAAAGIHMNNNLTVAPNLAPTKKKTISVLLENDKAAISAAHLVGGNDGAGSPSNRSFGSRSGASRSHLRSSFARSVDGDGKSPRDPHSPLHHESVSHHHSPIDMSSTALSPSYFAASSPGASYSTDNQQNGKYSRTNTSVTAKSSATTTTTTQTKPKRTQRIKNFFLCRHSRTTSGDESPLLGADDISETHHQINDTMATASDYHQGIDNDRAPRTYGGSRSNFVVAAKQAISNATTLVVGQAVNMNGSSFGGDFSAFEHTATRSSAVLPYSTEIHPLYSDPKQSIVAPPNSHVSDTGMRGGGNMAKDIAMELCGGFTTVSRLPPQPQPGSQVPAALTPRRHKEQVKMAMRQMESVVRLIRSCTLNAQDRLQSNAISVRRQHFAISIAVESYLHAQLYALIFPAIKQMSTHEDERLDHVRDHFYEILIRQREGGAAPTFVSRPTGLLMGHNNNHNNLSKEGSPSGVSEVAEDSPRRDDDEEAHNTIVVGATTAPLSAEEEAVIDAAYFGAAPSLKEFDPFIYRRLVAGINDNATSPLDKLQRIRALFLQVAEQAELVAAYNSYKARKEERRNQRVAEFMTPQRGRSTVAGHTTFSDEAQIISNNPPTFNLGDFHHREASVLSSASSTINGSFAAGFGSGAMKKEGICADDVIALLSLVLLACPCANLYSQIQYLVTFSSEATEEDSELEYAFVSFRVAVENLLQEEAKLNGGERQAGAAVGRAFIRTASTSSSSQHSGGSHYDK